MKGMLEAVGEVFPGAKYQRCTVHFYRNVFSVVPKSKVKIVAKMLKAIHAQESKKASREKAKAVVAELRAMKLKEAAKKVEDGIEETLTYCDFPSEHWTRIRTNNVIERLNREIRRRTHTVELSRRSPASFVKTQPRSSRGIRSCMNSCACVAL